MDDMVRADRRRSEGQLVGLCVKSGRAGVSGLAASRAADQASFSPRELDSTASS